MIPEVFKYKEKYVFNEYATMCDYFKGIDLPLADGLEINCLLADYIFCVSTDRIQTGWTNTLRRFCGSLFDCQFECEAESDNSDVAFVFTGDSESRKDYIDNIRSVAGQCDNSVLILLNRNKRRFKPWRTFGIFKELIWACKFNKMVHRFSVSLDMAVAVQRSVTCGKRLFRLVWKTGAKKLVTYCDQWSDENALTQLANRAGIHTATLQHGNGTEIFYGSCSDYYLANSRLSAVRKKCLSGKSEGTLVLEPMKFIGSKFEYIPPKMVQKLGIVLDGGDSRTSNIDMIEMAHAIADTYNVRCFFKFHPSTTISDYAVVLRKDDIISKDTAKFEKDIDLYIACKSTYYQELVYKCKSILRYRYIPDDWYPEVTAGTFVNIDELKNMFIQMIDPVVANEIHENVYNQIYGNEGLRLQYREFFKKWEV